jgi:hypothetical protein
MHTWILKYIPKEELISTYYPVGQTQFKVQKHVSWGIENGNFIFSLPLSGTDAKAFCSYL